MFSKTSSKLFIILTIILVAFNSLLIAEAPPELINYQGKLTNTSGVPLDGTYSMVFTIYDAETGGTSQWTETQSSVAVSKGIFNVILGSGLDGNPSTTGDNNPIAPSVFYDSQRWLGVQVGIDSEMIPRQKLTSVPYAYTADNLHGEVIVDPVTGNVGIGTTSPEARLEVERSNGDGILLDHSSFLSEARLGFFSGEAEFTMRNAAGNPTVKIASNGNMFFNTGGNVGIGSQTDYKLDVSSEGTNVGLRIYGGSGSNAGIRLESGGSNTEIHRSSFDFKFWMDGSPAMTILNNGNVGIGTTSPAVGYKLDVEGNIQANAFDVGDITFRHPETNEKLWRMFEKEDGLYLENAKTGKASRIFLEDEIAAIEEKIMKKVEERMIEKLSKINQ